MKTKQSLFAKFGQVLLSTSFPVPSPSLTILSSPFPLYLRLYQVFHLPAFFSRPHTSLQMCFPFVFSPFMLSWFPFHLPAFCSPGDEQPDVLLVPGHNFWNKHDLTRKNPETQKSNSPVGKGAYYYYQTHTGGTKKINLRISRERRESDFDSPRNHSWQPSLDKILGRSPHYWKF